MNKKPICILQIGMTRNIGGLETYLIQQFEHINGNNLKYDFVNITAEYEIVFSDKIKQKKSNIYNICSRHKNPIKHYYQWIRLLLNRKYDVIVLNSNSLEYVYPLVIAKIFGINRRIMHSHNTCWERNLGFFRKLLVKFNKLLLNFSATDYWACSELAGKWMFGNKKFKIIHNAIDTNVFKFNEESRNVVRKELGITNEKFVIGHVGRFSYQKNHDFLIDIFYEVCKISPQVELLLIGDVVDDRRFLDETKEKVKKLGLEQNVKFLGLRKDVPKLMQAMDCFVLPSRFEGLPLVGVEAQSIGLPCFFADIITKELKITDLANFISLNSSPKYWAKEIIKCKNIERRDKSKKIIEAGYDINTEIKKIEKFFTKGDKNEKNI